MLGRVVTNFSRKLLDKPIKYSNSDYLKDAKSLLELIKICTDNRDYIVIESKFGRKEVAYVHDIRFDYVHGKVFLPVFVYKYRELNEEDKKSFKRSKAYKKTDTFEVMYNQEVELFEIWNSTQGYAIDTLTILHTNFFGTKFFNISIKDLPLRDDIIEESAEVLMLKYVKSFVYNQEVTNTLYYSSNKSYLTTAERNLLKKYDLLWYSEDETPNKLNYRDARTYSILDVCKTFDDDELDLGVSFFYRVIDFESYLLCHLAEHVYWTDCKLENLRSGRWYFEKYKYRNIALIFKDYWLKPYKQEV